MNKKKKTKFKPIYNNPSEKEKVSIKENLTKGLNLPQDVLLGAPLVTITGKQEAHIENYRGIIEYNGNSIKIQTKSFKICIEGCNLLIEYFTNDEMKITGTINSIFYC